MVPSKADRMLGNPLDSTSPSWRVATVERVIEETPRVKTIVLDAPEWPGHTAGQYVDVRLTDESGYQTERAYSIASAPEDPQLALSVERIPDGEVSQYLTERLRARDRLELRGPVGAHFTWRAEDGGPLVLIAGGTGLAPLMAMLRHRAARSSIVETQLLVSARSPAEALYRDELAALTASEGVSIAYAFTHGRPAGWSGVAGYSETELLTSVGPAPTCHPRIFVCGAAPFVGATTSLLARAGYESSAIRAQDIAPAGG
jgi:ferredoxin-NADP reductase